MSEKRQPLRKSITLPHPLWDAIDVARRGSLGRVPSEAEMVRVLLREALAARSIQVQPEAGLDALKRKPNG
jgi:hypothetical protein